MPRIRFNENPVDELLTFSEYIGMYYEEPVILHYTAQKLPFTHWSDVCGWLLSDCFVCRWCYGWFRFPDRCFGRSL